MSADVVRVDAIRVEDRARKEYRSIDSLAGSIETLGLLHPPVVTPDLRLIAGGRRLEAVKALGWERVPVTVADDLSVTADLLQAEADENTEREPLTPSEASALAKRIEDALKPLAAERKREGRNQYSEPPANFAEPSEPRPRDAGAKVAGLSHETIRKVRHVEEVVESESTPEPVREVAQAALKTMNETGNVHGAFRAVKQAEESVVEVRPEAVAISEAIKSDPDLIDRQYMLAFSKSIARADDLFIMDAARIGRLASPDDLESLRQFTEQAAQFYNDVLAARPGLRLVNKPFGDTGTSIRRIASGPDGPNAGSHGSTHSFGCAAGNGASPKSVSRPVYV